MPRLRTTTLSTTVKYNNKDVKISVVQHAIPELIIGIRQ